MPSRREIAASSRHAQRRSLFIEMRAAKYADKALIFALHRKRALPGRRYHFIFAAIGPMIDTGQSSEQ